MFIKKSNIQAVFTSILMAFLLMTPVSLYAQETGSVDIMPAQSLAGTSPDINAEDATHAPVRLTPDKSELIRLDKEAATVVVGNPAHLSVLAENSKTLVLVPRLPGATYIAVLGHDSNIVMQRHVIVASPKDKYVRIRRSCASGEVDECQRTQVYYCPDMCHEIAVVSGDSEAASEASSEGTDSTTEEGASGEVDDVAPE